MDKATSTKRHRALIAEFKGLKQRYPGIFWTCILLIFIVLFLYHHLHKQVVPQKTVSVVAAHAERQDVPIYLTEIGSVTPRQSITVKTQINGQLFHVFYKEGQMVKKGELLAQIDPRPYEAQLIEYVGALKRDQALLDNAKIDLHRYQTLWKQDSISQQTLATQVSLVNQYEGSVESDKGLIQLTKVNLIYCRITSPVDGRIGLRLVDPGNFVQTTDTTGLAVVNTLNPITVIFTIPEDNVPQVLPLANKKLPVDVYDRQQNKRLATGSLLTIDNQVNQSTGTVKLRAIFNNKNNVLFPNQFVNVKLLLDTLHQATIIPTAAIQHGNSGDYVFLIKPDNTVNIKPITTGAVFGENTVIHKGVNPGDSVVVEGADKLTNQSKVVVTYSAGINNALKEPNKLTQLHNAS